MKKRGREIFIIDDITDYIPQNLCETIGIFLCFVLFRRGVRLPEEQSDSFMLGQVFQEK